MLVFGRDESQDKREEIHSRKKERKQKGSRQQALEADMPLVSDYSWREGVVERGVSGGGTGN